MSDKFPEKAILAVLEREKALKIGMQPVCGGSTVGDP